MVVTEIYFVLTFGMQLSPILNTIGVMALSKPLKNCVPKNCIVATIIVAEAYKLFLTEKLLRQSKGQAQEFVKMAIIKITSLKVFDHSNLLVKEHIFHFYVVLLAVLLHVKLNVPVALGSLRKA